MHHYLKAEISAAAIRSNLAVLREHVGPDCKLCAVVKCNAYGHGLDLLLPVLAEGADWLAVATPGEALHLRDLGYAGPLLVFFTVCTEGQSPLLDELLRQRVTLTVAGPGEIDILARAVQRTDCDAKVHLMVDTGMTRSGILPADVPTCLERLRQNPAMRLTGIYTHLATADEADKSPARKQLARFQRALDVARVGSGLLRHAANSAAAIDLPEARYDMVRTGIALYGYQPSDELHSRLNLRPAMRLTAHLMQIKDVSAGEAIGYGGTDRLEKPSRLGLVPVGYGDGYPRSLSNQGASMRIAGRDAPVRGRVSMDQTIIDLTDIPTARIGDVVEIVSPDPDAPHSLEQLAKKARTIPYEIICRLGQRVRRSLLDHYSQP